MARKQREAGFLISKIHYLAGRILASKQKHYNIAELNPAQGRIMFVLWHNDGISIQELARKTALGKSTLTGMLDRLEAAGFVTRTPSTEDRRKILLNLTGKDKGFQEVFTKVSTEMTELFYHGFTPQEIDEFEEYLRRILDNLVQAEIASAKDKRSYKL